MTENNEKNLFSRRDFLAAAAYVMGAAGVVAASYPFIKAMSPAKDVLAAGVLEADISNLAPGGIRTIIWRKQPVFILRRTPEMIAATVGTGAAGLKDPAPPEERFIRPDLFVGIAICTHLGCIPKYVSGRLPDSDQPGFYCPCHGGKYDTLGRRLAGPPPENLHLVPYRIEGEKLIIGTERFAGYGEDIRSISKLPKA